MSISESGTSSVPFRPPQDEPHANPRVALPGHPAPPPKSAPSHAAAIAYIAGLAVRTLGALVTLLVACTPLLVWYARGPGMVDRPATAGGLIVGFLAVLGGALPIVAVVLARADWVAAVRLTRVRATGPLPTRWGRPRTWARPLAYAAVQLTAGGAFAITSALGAVAVIVALFSPLLVATGDSGTLGPLVVRTPLAAWVVAVSGVLVSAGAVLASPRAAAWHAHLVFGLLTNPEQRLQHDLALTSQSRRRVVEAFDVERRRIERDLHDGVQPQLMSVSMTLGLALAAMPNETPGRDDVIRAQQQARDVVEDMRRFVRAIHPQVLTDHGLGAAVGELADGFTIPTTITDRLTTRPPAAVETNLYYCVAELLTNAVKHARAESIEVVLSHATPSGFRVTVHDNGNGGASQGRGGGLAGITDRVAALGGTLNVSSPPGGPTGIEITVPDLRHGSGSLRLVDVTELSGGDELEERA